MTDKQEPIAWCIPSTRQFSWENQDDRFWKPLYTHPEIHDVYSEFDVTDGMALAFHNALTDGSIGQEEVEEIKRGLRAALSVVTITEDKCLGGHEACDCRNYCIADSK